MDLTRRDFLGFCGGGAAFAVVAGLGLRPRTAYAVAGIDDAALGGLVLLVATLGGYAVSRSVANASLQALGYGFSDFVADAGNQAAAVTQTLADANNLSVELSRSNAEQAAASIAAGTGYFGQVMADAATSGRVALDNFISGASELPGVLRNLVASFVETKLSTYPTIMDGVGTTDLVDNDFVFSSLNGSTIRSVATLDIADMGYGGIDVSNYEWCILRHYYNATNGVYLGGTYLFGNCKISIKLYGNGANAIDVTPRPASDRFSLYGINRDGSLSSLQNSGGVIINYNNTGTVNDFIFSSSLVGGGVLPGVDRAADAPDVIGPGYDSLPLGNDLVIDPSTGDVVSAGSLPLPTGIPDVLGDFVGTLEDLLAGVVPGVIGLPVSVTEPVVVGTAEGVTSMPIIDAIATETSLAAPLDPPAPTPPPGTVDPPVTVPEGPWTPAVALPFAQLWPFNMIYSFVQLFDDLGA